MDKRSPRKKLVFSNEVSLVIQTTLKNRLQSGGGGACPLIPTLREQRQVDLCEFEASLDYKMSSRTARAVLQKNPIS